MKHSFLNDFLGRSGLFTGVLCGLFLVTSCRSRTASSPSAGTREQQVVGAVIAPTAMTTSTTRGFRDRTNSLPSEIKPKLGLVAGGIDTTVGNAPVEIVAAKPPAAVAPPKPMVKWPAAKLERETQPKIETQLVSRLGTLGIKAGYVSLMILVRSVEPESTADRAGIKPGDLHLKIGELDPAIVQMEALKPLVGEVGHDVLVRWRSNMEIREARLVYGESAAR